MCGMPALATKAREVMMVFIEHWFMAASMASAPEVKFRFTGTLPAIRAAVFASAPPTDEGRSMATISCLRHLFLIHPAMSREAARALPHESALPVESAMHW